MNSENPWLDGMHEHSRALRNSAGDLRDLARAFSRIGNGEVAAELFEIAKTINDEADKAADLTHKKVHHEYREAVQSSANVVRSLLAGVEMAKREATASKVG